LLPTTLDSLSVSLFSPQWPLFENLSNVLAGRPPPPLWKVSVKDSVQLHTLMDSVITAPLLVLLDEDSKAKVGVVFRECSPC